MSSKELAQQRRAGSTRFVIDSDHRIYHGAQADDGTWHAVGMPLAQIQHFDSWGRNPILDLLYHSKQLIPEGSAQ